MPTFSYQTGYCAQESGTVSLEAEANEQLLLQGHRYYNSKIYDKAFRIYETLAKQNMADAEYSFGLMYLQGLGTPKY